jgi:hypothetical protein
MASLRNSLVLCGTLALFGACKSRSFDSATASRADASPHGVVKTKKEDMKFEPDDALAKTAADASRDAVDFAKKNFDIVLDGTDASVSELERLLDAVYRHKPDAAPDERTVSRFGAMFGSYVGEVFRKNHGGQWGFITSDGPRFPGMRADRSGQLFWPWGRVNNRLLNGPGDNVYDYYRIIVRDDVYK